MNAADTVSNVRADADRKDGTLIVPVVARECALTAVLRCARVGEQDLDAGGRAVDATSDRDRSAVDAARGEAHALKAWIALRDRLRVNGVGVVVKDPALRVNLASDGVGEGLVARNWMMITNVPLGRAVRVAVLLDGNRRKEWLE